MVFSGGRRKENREAVKVLIDREFDSLEGVSLLLDAGAGVLRR
jgi:hypothetical protein